MALKIKSKKPPARSPRAPQNLSTPGNGRNEQRRRSAGSG
jgi:hypothetical protein